MAVIIAASGCNTAPKTEVQAGASLPVYEVSKTGASDAEAAAVADSLRIPASGLSRGEGSSHSPIPGNSWRSPWPTSPTPR